MNEDNTLVVKVSMKTCGDYHSDLWVPSTGDHWPFLCMYLWRHL